MYPDKFRSVSQRRTATGIQTILGVTGVALGAIIPPLFITFGNLESYIIQGFVAFSFTLVTMIIAIPGVRENKESVENYLKSQSNVVKRASFFKEVLLAFKQKSFVAFIILFLMYQTLVPSMTGSIPYVVRYILKMPASATTLIMAAMLIGTIISIPFWIKLAHKLNDNRKITLISITLMGILTVPLIFLESYIPIIINMLIWGISLGGFGP